MAKQLCHSVYLIYRKNIEYKVATLGYLKVVFGTCESPREDLLVYLANIRQ